ncbi:MAG TPA: formylglycine-generating enzyme family protein, partial [Pyrinomonadaceae bacterium]|nr:formylglycine-generating enzyme family protein [Pyrinomonadaceae bacterium]
MKKNWVIIWVLIIAALFAGAGFLFMRGRALDNSKQANNKPSPTPAFVKGEAPKSPVPADRLQTFDFVTVTVDANGQIKTRETKQGTEYTEDLNGTQLQMVAVPGGTFLMGSPDFETNRKGGELQHRVRIEGFYIGKYEVTQAQYEGLMDHNPSMNKGPNLPVENNSLDEATEFCRRLSEKTGRKYRLPSEAEWEYAARAGTSTPFAFGPTITPELVNYDGDLPYGSTAKGLTRKGTIPVGSTGVANTFGLYDMHGNVWERCADDWHESYGGYSTAPNDGSVWEGGSDPSLHVIRGGAWNYFA